MNEPSTTQKDSSTRPYTQMELFVRERRPGDPNFHIACRLGPSASAGVAEVYGTNVGMTPDVMRALAHLLAAAPQLLEALEKTVKRCICGGHGHMLMPNPSHGPRPSVDCHYCAPARAAIQAAKETA